MVLKKRKFTSLVLAFSIFASPVIVEAKSKPSRSRDIIYEGYSYTTQVNNLNLIINDIYETYNGLVVDAYLYNTTNRIFSDIGNFNLEIRDSYGAVIAQKVFRTISIKGGLSPLQGKRVFLNFGRRSYNLKNKDLTNISWAFTYNYRDKE
ncbi:hypothetical protein [Clostridium tarantellae]|uniref:Uncharacterized protein n=1 Tax=Clostridium tarantellae TaxID=39493 RepID=A0A6I1MMV8_9CLOT|nr:hypothetical protein [Clostridium tarantellae]MPQ44103.1 hypothetical protein [Clostridium tarantellae]